MRPQHHARPTVPIVAACWCPNGDLPMPRPSRWAAHQESSNCAAQHTCRSCSMARWPGPIHQRHSSLQIRRGKAVVEGQPWRGTLMNLSARISAKNTRSCLSSTSPVGRQESSHLSESIRSGCRRRHARSSGGTCASRTSTRERPSRRCPAGGCRPWSGPAAKPSAETLMQWILTRDMRLSSAGCRWRDEAVR